MFILQNIRYENILKLYFQEPNNEVLRSVVFMQSIGNDLNWILGISLILFTVNLILFRSWIKGERWILHPLIIFIITLFVTVYLHSNRVDRLKEGMKNINSQ